MAARRCCCALQQRFEVLHAARWRLGSESVATGHYAGIERSPVGRWLLKRSLNRDEDQSYFLFSLTHEPLGRRGCSPVGIAVEAGCPRRAHRLWTGRRQSKQYRRSLRLPIGATMQHSSPAAASDARGGAIVAGRSARIEGVHGKQHKVRDRNGHAPLCREIDAEWRRVMVRPRHGTQSHDASTASDVNWVSVDAPSGWLRASTNPPWSIVRRRERVRARRAWAGWSSKQSPGCGDTRAGVRVLRRGCGRRRRLGSRLDLVQRPGVRLR